MRQNKRLVHKKLFIIYTCMIIFIVGALDFYFIKEASDEVKKNNMYINEKIIQDVSEILEFNYNTSKVITDMLYQDLQRLEDVIDYLKMDLVTYLTNKLDKYSDGNKLTYNGTDHLVQSAFNLNNNLDYISFVSYERMETRIFNKKKQVKLLDTIDRDFWENNIPIVVFNKNYISHISEIRNKTTFKPEGLMVLTYNLNQVEDILNKYKSDIFEVMLLNSEGKVIYDSEHQYEFVKYEYYDKLVNSGEKVQLEELYYTNISLDKHGTMIVGRIKARNAMQMPVVFYISAIVIGIILFSIAEIILYVKFKKISERLETILVVMEDVEKGNMNNKIPITDEDDEITLISRHFNQMCERLDEHIKKSYVAELSQKNAEIVALQNQINPHFLYNTLESIRMKAICNGDKEVGKMLYSLAFLFRSQVKEKILITIKQEIDYCKKYLELFRFRYEDKFEFNISCDEGVLDNEIIKFTLQPLIENYFVHGIRLEDDNNEFNISIKEENDNIKIVMVDNGRGIEETKLEEINTKLKNMDYSGQSIGLLNVHERIVINYGKSYGVTLEKNELGGTTIIVRFPIRGGYKNV